MRRLVQMSVWYRSVLMSICCCASSLCLRPPSPPLFPSVSDAALFDLSAFLSLTSFRRGQTLYREGERLAHVFLLLTPGTVALSQLVSGAADQQQQQHGSMPNSGQNTRRSSSHSQQALSPLVAKLNRLRSRGRGSMASGRLSMALDGAPLNATTAPAPAQPASRLLAVVSPGMILGARFSSSIAGAVPPPMEETDPAVAEPLPHPQSEADLSRLDEHGVTVATTIAPSFSPRHEHSIISSHTATARRNIHLLVLSLDLFLRFFPDRLPAPAPVPAEEVHAAADGVQEKEDSVAGRPDYHSLPTSPAHNPFRRSFSPGAADAAAAVADDERPSTPPRRQLPRARGSPPPQPRVAHMVHALSEASLIAVPAHKHSAAAALAHSASAHTLLPAEPSPPVTADPSARPLGDGDAADTAPSPPAAVASASAEPTDPTSPARPRPLDLPFGDSDQSAIKILSSSSATASAAVTAGVAAAADATGPVLAAASAPPPLSSLNLPSPELRALKQRGAQMWHVLQDAVGLQNMLHKEKKKEGKKKSHTASATDSALPSSRALQFEAELAGIPENGAWNHHTRPPFFFHFVFSSSA